MTYALALVCGVAVGMTLSFVLSKVFAFRSKDWSSTPQEIQRFVAVYGCSVIIYYLGALAMRPILLGAQLSSGSAEMLAVLFGAGLMAVASYLGHRFFTYRTHERRSGT